MCAHNPLFYRKPATCVFSLLLSDTPFTDRVFFSIQGRPARHIFTVPKCWHAEIRLSASQLAITQVLLVLVRNLP